MNLFDLVPKLGLEMEPVLTRLDTLLEDDRLFQLVKADLIRRFPRTATDGRPCTPVEVILRLLIVKHLYSFSYEQTEKWVSDSLVLRQFCRLYLEPVPDDTTLIRWANLIQPDTLHQLLDRVMVLARSLKVTRARKLRTDGTIVQTNIHYPSDSALLGDGIRVLCRTLKKAKPLLHTATDLGRDAFRDRTRSARRLVKHILEATRQRGKEAEQQMQAAYRKLIQATQAVLEQSRQVGEALQEQATQAASRLTQILHRFIPRVEQVIAQTSKRVLEGASVAAPDKLVSLFEPHTVIIRKGKPACPLEFGRVLWLDEVDGGLISRYAVLEGNPPEEDQIKPTLDHHVAVFGKAPRLLAGDRGTFSTAGESYASGMGVKQVVLPKPGAKSPERVEHERQPWFRRARKWRAGIEGRISVLKRGLGLERCLYHGDAGMQRWVGWGIIAHDLRQIALATIR
jgi:IS5 family transposase